VALASLCAAELAHAAALAREHDLAERALAEARARRRASQAIFEPWVDIAAVWVSGPAGGARHSGGGAVCGLYAAHALAAARQDGQALDQVASSLASAGASLLAAEAAAQAALAHRRAGRQASARAAAASSARWLEACQGAWTPALGTLEVPRLTQRELQIARLASRACATARSRTGWESRCGPSTTTCTRHTASSGSPAAWTLAASSTANLAHEYRRLAPG
jgi:hypothetical protein